MNNRRIATGVVLTILLSCCDGDFSVEETPAPNGMRSVSAGDIDALLKKRIFFGHQSVGFNIIDGIVEVLKDEGRRGFVFVETRDLSTAEGPVFLHATVGTNGDPVGKIRDFDAIMRGGMAEHVDVAFMKLCYVDIQADTDVQEVFHAYRDTMAGLKASYPRTRFVNLTVPLVTRERGLKSVVKRLLGRPLSGYTDNIRRQELNELMRAEYSGREPLFDLARFESTRADGSRITFAAGNSRYYALEGTYSDDGGHLNEIGRRFIAEQLLVFLARLLR
jgi:hypothetical protein